MRTILTIIFLLNSFFWSFSQEVIKTDLTKQSLKGKVKTLSERSYFLEEVDGQIQKGRLTGKDTYLYNEQGNLLENSHFNTDILLWNSIYKYDAMGNRIEESRFEAEGELSWKECYKYDDNGNQIELKRFKSNGRLDAKYISSYDETGNVIENIIYDSPDYSSRKIIYSYNARGDLTEKSRYQTEGQLLEKENYEFVYDHDNLIEEKQYKFFQGTEETSITFKFYNFDKNGNWLKEIYYMDDKAYSISEREIEYYED